MINLFYHVKVSVWGNKYTKLGNKTIATFYDEEDAKDYRKRFNDRIPPNVSGWLWADVYKDYGQKDNRV